MAYQELARTCPPKTAIGGNPHEIGVFPLDIHNAELLDHVAPMDWKNPERGDDFVYDLVAIGAGAGGLVSTEETLSRGFKTALIEKHMNGGDCLNVGCVPSKALLRSAKAIKEARNCATFGVEATFQGVNFSTIMSRLRARRAEIAPVDSAPGAQSRGTDMYFGEGMFTGRNEISVRGKTLRFRKAVIATGGSAFVPPIPGLKDTPFITNAALYNLTELPKRMLVVGAGPIGCEMAQSFAIFGSKVTVIADAFLPREDADASAIVREALHKDGVQFDLPCKILRVEHVEGLFRVFTSTRSEPHEAEVLLVAAGRKPNVDGAFEKADVKFDQRTGVHVNEFLQTSNPDIYSVGDCASKFNFTHVSAHMAGIAVDNALFGEKRSMAGVLIPWVTYTFPEIGHVGKYAHEVADGVDTYQAIFEENDRAIVEDCKEGFVKLHCAKGTDRIVGATIVSEHAGEMLHELSVCIQFGISIGALAGVIHSYPTLSQGIESAANKYRTSHWKKAGDVPIAVTQSEVEAAATKVRAVKAAGASPDEVKKAVDAYLALRSVSGLSASAEVKPTPPVAEVKVPSSSALEAAAAKVRALKSANAPEADVKAAVGAYRVQEAAERVRAVKAAGADAAEVKAAVDAYIALNNEVNAAQPSQASTPSVASDAPSTAEEAANRVRSLKASGAPQAEVQAAVDAFNAFKPTTSPSVSSAPGSTTPSAHSALKAAADKVRALKSSGAAQAEVKAAVDAYVALSEAGEAKATTETTSAPPVAQAEPKAAPAASQAVSVAADKVRALKAAGAPQAEVQAAVAVYLIAQAEEKVRSLKASNAPQEEVRAACAAYAELTKPPVSAPVPAPQASEPETKADAGPVKTELDIARDRVRTLKANNASEAEVKDAVRIYSIEEAKARVRTLKTNNAPMEEVKAAVEAYNALNSAASSAAASGPAPAVSEPATPTVSEPAATPAVSEPTPTPAVSEPAATPAVSEPAATPAVSEPAATPAVSEPAATPAVSEPTPTPAVSEPAATPAVSEPTPTPTPTEQTVPPTSAPTAVAVPSTTTAESDESPPVVRLHMAEPSSDSS
jgi:pyruvate/2-oxoglutarate dehydrogenase complex dihydrolipoamide dehydrogenase (E3) component